MVQFSFNKSFEEIEQKLTLLNLSLKDIENLLNTIKHTQLKSKDVFEFYTDSKGNIEKLCYRITYTYKDDIILVVSNTKNIVTIYLNSVEDNHTTLKEHLYNTGV